jgi:hypothetical protein
VLDDGSRMIVVSWMVEVAEEFGLQQETLHAAVNLLDRFLCTSNVSSSRRVCVGRARQQVARAAPPAAAVAVVRGPPTRHTTPLTP